MKCLRIHRLIKSYFGNYKNFVAWCVAVGLAVFTIDSLISPRFIHPKTRSASVANDELSMRTIASAIDGGGGGTEEQEEQKEDEDLGQEDPQQQQLRKKSVVHPVHCGLSTDCPKGSYSYYVRSGYGRDTSAKICFNENFIVAEDRVTSDRGLNMLVINDETLQVEELKVFDVYTNDASLISYLKKDIKDNHIFFVVSHDEASFNLTSKARREFYNFGSTVLDRVNFRDNYAIIGQKGLEKGQAIEKLEARPAQMQFAESAVLSGCLKIPIGKMRGDAEEPQPPAPAPAGGKAAAEKPKESASKAKETKEAVKKPKEGELAPPPQDKKPSAKVAEHQNEPKPAEPQSQQDKKSADAHPAEKKPAEKKPVDEKPAEKKPSENKPAENKPAENKPAEQKPPEKKPVDKKAAAPPAIKKDEKKPVPPKSPPKLGDEARNCGVKVECPKDEFPVQLFTGYQAKELPKICVAGKYVMAEGLNDAGRGLNFVVFDPKTKEVTRVARFDTYSTDDNALELFLEMLNDDEIILAVAHDEATNKLDKSARELLEYLGSSFIHRLAFRDVWAFVGQKGISGFSPYEQFEFSDADTVRQVLTWPSAIDMKICIPTKLNALPKRKILLRNEARKNFCKKHDGYGDFCRKENVDQLLIPATLNDTSLVNDPIFSIPIAIVSGLEYNSLRRQLEALFTNPGINIDKIIVFFDEKFEEAGELAKVFNVSSHKLDSSIKYTELMEKALFVIWKLFPTLNYAIILEEEVFPSVDFLNFFRQCLPALEADETLAGISAWNDNAYYLRARLRHHAYRVEMLPGLGFLLKRSFYEQQLKTKMPTCCARRSWEGWTRDETKNFEMIIPDVSRVGRGQYNGRITDLLQELFRRPRESTRDLSVMYEVSNANSLVADKYEASLEEAIPKAVSFSEKLTSVCLTGGEFVFPNKLPAKQSYAVFYEQTTKTDDKILLMLCKCFNIFHVNGYKTRGVHRGLVRFSFNDHMVFLIGSKTEYFKLKPKDAQVLQLQSPAA